MSEWGNFIYIDNDYVNENIFLKDIYFNENNDFDKNDFENNNFDKNDFENNNIEESDYNVNNLNIFEQKYLLLNIIISCFQNNFIFRKLSRIFSVKSRIY